MVNTCSKSTVKNLQQRLWISSSPKLAIPSSYFSHKFISKFEPAEGIFDIFVVDLEQSFTCTPSSFTCPNQQWEHQNNVWDLFKVKSKDTRTTLLTFLLTCNRFYTLLCCFHCLLWTSKCQLRKVYIKGFSVLSVLIVLCELDVTYDLLGFHDIFFLSRKLYRISSLRIAQELRLLFKTNYLRKHFSGSTA